MYINKIELVYKIKSMFRIGVDAGNSLLETEKTEEDALLNGVRDLKQKALIEAHARYYSAIFHYIIYKVGSQETAEDLTSEVFVRFLDAVFSTKAPRKTIRGWLYSVANHVVKDYYRKRYRRKPTISLSWPIESGRPNPDAQLIKKESFHELYEAIDDLTRSQQDVVALRFGFGMPIREVARAIGKTEGAVKQLQARALASLARKMAPKKSPEHTPSN
jgi:RNA polymerase sigma-70 factor (ECF subfamily)